MDDLTENLAIRCSAADLEIIDRLREDRSRSALVRILVRKAGREAAVCA